MHSRLRVPAHGRRIKLSLALLFLLVACVRSAGPPEVAPRSVLAPGTGERGVLAEDGAFRVTFAAPQGQASEVSEISIVFSRPLRSLEHEAPLPALRMTPAIAGHWSWVGARALSFATADGKRLPGATAFRIEIPAGTRAVDGAPLDEPFTFSFETPRPSLSRSAPEGTGLAPDQRIELWFSQVVEPRELERRFRLVATPLGSKTEKRLGFRVTRPDPGAPKRLEIVPNARLPIAHRIQGVVEAGLVGTEGPLATTAPQSFDFSTYGPLRITEATCYAQGNLCRAGTAPTVSFSNAVSWGSLKAALSVEPPVPLRWESWQRNADTTESVWLPARLEAGKTYTLRVDPELRDRFGQRLGTAFTKAFRIADFEPALEIGVEGQAVAPAARVSIPLGALNVPAYDLVQAPLDAERVLSLLERKDLRNAAFLATFPGARREAVTTAGSRNAIARRELDLGALLPGGRGAAGVALFGKVAKMDQPPVELLKVSDLAISARLGPDGSAVWVTRLSSAAPVKDAEVELLKRGAPRRSYRTDAHGVARIPAGDFAVRATQHDFEEEVLVVARAGQDWTFEALSTHVSPWRLPVPTDFSARAPLTGMMFTERGIYRPGETVRLKGIARKPVRTGNELLVDAPLDVSLYSPNDELVERRRVTTNRFGTFAVSLAVPGSAPLGQFVLRLTPPGAPDVNRWEQRSSASFQVAEYRPAEFSVSAKPEARSYVRGARARFRVQGDYLYGAPMNGATLSYTVSRNPAWFEVPGHERYLVNAGALYAEHEERALRSGVLASGESKLDTGGTAHLETPLELPGQRSTESVTATVELSDASQQAIGATATTLVHPADFYLGIEAPEDWFVNAPGSLTPKILALTPDGKRVSGVNVEVELVLRRWTLAREQLAGAPAHAVSTVVDQKLGSCRLTTGAAPASCRLDVKEAGYLLVVARATDAKRRPVEAALGIYGIGPGEASWGDTDRASIELIPNKKQYRVGETARLLVKSPFPEAEAWITVERRGVYRSERRKLRGATPIVEIPITEELRPNAFVGVQLVRARTPGKREAEVGASYRIGYVDLKVDPEARRLAVRVKPSTKDAKPGDEVRVDLEVTGFDGRGRATELAVFAVDEGVLSLTGYVTPDPLPVFTASRPLGTALLETREALARIGLTELPAILGGDKGRDGGGGGDEGGRQDFRQTAFFEPAVVTDEQGRASVRFRLPDTLTTYRIMATAVTLDDRYGFGQASVTASKPLMARPALPRFLRAGDTLEASVLAASKGFAPGAVEVTASAEGLVLEGAGKQAVTLGRDASAKVRFRFRAERAGSAKLRFSVHGGGQSDTVTITRRVDVPAALETIAVYGSTQNEAGERLGALRGLRDDAGGLEVRVSSSALAGMTTELQDLLAYPYGCTEQLVSRLLPLVPLRELSRDFGLPAPKDGDAVVAATVRDILGRQREDGGFGMWTDAPASSSWVSPYALWVLHEAAQRGVSVPKSALARGKAYVRDLLAHEDVHGPAALSLAVDVLAMLGAPDNGHALRLAELGRELPLFARGLLLHALVLGKAPEPSIRSLIAQMEGELRIAGDAAYVSENTGDRYAVLMDSPQRTAAIVLRALLAARPEHPLITPLARGLLAAQRRAAFTTTQESAFALLALDAYRRVKEKEAPSFDATVWLGERRLLEFSARGRSTLAKTATVTMAELMRAPNQVVAFTHEGSGTLHYEARLRHAARELPAAPLDRGFFLKKTLSAVSRAVLAAEKVGIPERGATRFLPGDLVIGDLVVVVPSSRKYVVVDDPLPAGFEAVDPSLATTVLGAPLLDAPEACAGCEREREDATAHGRAYRTAWFRRELRDDRVLFFVDDMPAGMYHYRYLARATSSGSFVIPPSKVEAMYEPEIFGRTGALRIEVR